MSVLSHLCGRDGELDPTERRCQQPSDERAFNLRQSSLGVGCGPTMSRANSVPSKYADTLAPAPGNVALFGNSFWRWQVRMRSGRVGGLQRGRRPGREWRVEHRYGGSASGR